jgi:nucleotide-binding universal stress UspA family protein
MSTLAEVAQQQIPRQEATLSFKSILLATDFSNASEKAFNYAIAIARLCGSKVYLVHALRPEFTSVVPEPPSDWVRHEAEREMEALANRSELKPIAHETVLRTGPIWSVISAVIRQQNIDLVVLGTHGRGGLKKLVLGSVAEEVVRRVGCPVITVGPHIDVALGTAGGFHRILYATDFHPSSAKALECALLLANQFRAKLILLHLMPPAVLPGPGITFYDEKAIDEWQAKVRASTKHSLEALLPVSIKLWSEPEYVVDFDFVAEGILRAAAEEKADLIIMGANRSVSAKVSAHALKAVSYEIICRSKCPVLTVSTKTGRLWEE